MGERHFRLIVFKNGKRIERRVPAVQLDAAKTKVRSLRAEGHKAIIARGNVTRYSTSYYPPTDEIEENRLAGKLWCPYCRSWRYFKVPRPHPYNGDAVVDLRVKFLNSCYGQLIPICAWCEISIYDYHIGKVNQIFAEVRGAQKRRRRRNRRARRG